jgi:serine O-acetyltransferase
MFERVFEDITAKADLRFGQPGIWGHLKTIGERGTIAVMVYRFGRFARQTRVPLLKPLLMIVYYVLFYLVQMFTGISIQAYADIGRRFVVRNFSGIFVLAERIGSDCTVCEGVTVGNIRGKGRLPVIGDRVYLEPGCKVLGAVTIGDDVVIRANSLILSDVPSQSIAVGNPARILPLNGAS